MSNELAPNQVSVLSRYRDTAISLAASLGENPQVLKGTVKTILTFANERDADAFLMLFLDATE